MAKSKKKKPVAKKVVKKAAAKKSVVKKSTAKKSLAKKAPGKKAISKKTSAKKSSAKKASVKKAAPKKVAPQKAVVTKAMPNKASAEKVDLSNFVTPLDDRVLVKLTEAERMTAGGLYIPDTVADVSGNLQGVVVSIGRGHRNKKGQVRPMDVKIGDKVLFSEYSGSKIKIQDQDLIILREGDVLGVVG